MPIDDGFVYQPPLEPLDIIFEDDDFIAINKPAGLLSVPGRLAEHHDSAYFRVLALYPHTKITHRLDMATSGILLFAKHREAEVAASKMFQARTIKKNYIALVQGQIAVNGQVDVPLMTDWENRPRQIVHFDLGKPAQTLFECLSYDATKDMSRVLLTPITGRSHQLRVHMQYIGHPILRDKLYHPEPFKTDLTQMALHASYLSFMQPFSNQLIEIISEPEF